MNGQKSALINANELANRLGVSYSSVLRWARDGAIPCERAGGNYIRFDYDDVRAAMKLNGKVRS